MDTTEKRICAILQKKRDRLFAKLEKQGGRGVVLAEHIDRLDAAIEALNGELTCQHCGAQLVGFG